MTAGTRASLRMSLHPLIPDGFRGGTRPADRQRVRRPAAAARLASRRALTRRRSAPDSVLRLARVGHRPSQAGQADRAFTADALGDVHQGAAFGPVEEHVRVVRGAGRTPPPGVVPPQLRRRRQRRPLTHGHRVPLVIVRSCQVASGRSRADAPGQADHRTEGTGTEGTGTEDTGAAAGTRTRVRLQARGRPGVARHSTRQTRGRTMSSPKTCRSRRVLVQQPLTPSRRRPARGSATILTRQGVRQSVRRGPVRCQPGGWQPGGWQPGGWQPGGWQQHRPGFRAITACRTADFALVTVD
jgi:hypothetical protein